ncbi:MAG TPA: hypothetical protein VGO96_03055 [Pyrinomonadaceae bacterium]|jgi:hypothetical protein|nr:hypothetical protein [Pyrinomonadaceae bacterium]
MLFIESKSLDYAVDGATRTSLLENLQEQGFVPLIRSARLHLYEVALAGAEGVRELERALAARADVEAEAPYVRGELFCVEDYALFLLFGDAGGDEAAGVRAGIIYEGETHEPLDKLEAFCRSIGEALEAARRSGVGGVASGAENGGVATAGLSGDTGSGAPHAFAWKRREGRASESFRRFAETETATPANARGEMVEGWLRSSGMLEDTQARGFLRRLSEAHREGRTVPGALPAGEGVPDALLNRLAEVGLLKREILVSCRKDGRALFRLPSPDAFSILSGSNAVCNECGAAIADEKAEEVTVPTSLTATLLQDGAWLATHLRSIISKLGVPEKQIVARATGGEGEVRLMVNVCGEAFLCLLHDGDWTTAQARRALDEHAKSDSAHLVLIATGKIQEDARQRLREHARRRTQNGRELELILVEGMDAVAAELQPAFERVASNALAEELWELDTSLGLSAGQLIATRFRLMQRPGALRDLAASAAASMSGSLHEF